MHFSNRRKDDSGGPTVSAAVLGKAPTEWNEVKTWFIHTLPLDRARTSFYRGFAHYTQNSPLLAMELTIF